MEKGRGGEGDMWREEEMERGRGGEGERVSEEEMERETSRDGCSSDGSFPTLLTTGTGAAHQPISHP